MNFEDARFAAPPPLNGVKIKHFTSHDALLRGGNKGPANEGFHKNKPAGAERIGRFSLKYAVIVIVSDGERASGGQRA